MIIEVSPRPLPGRTFVSLSAALTWLLFDRAMELPELLNITKTQGVPDEALQATLTSEWLDLADYACRGPILIRGRRAGRPKDATLALEDLRNCRHVGWEVKEYLTVDPFPFTFGGGFQSRSISEFLGFTLVEVSRKGAIEWKKERTRLRRTQLRPDYEGAEAMINAELPFEQKCVGHKARYVRRLETEFRLPHYQAVKMWTKGALAHGIPLRGRPSKTRTENTRRISGAEEFSPD